LAVTKKNMLYVLLLPAQTGPRNSEPLEAIGEVIEGPLTLSITITGLSTIIRLSPT